MLIDFKVRKAKLKRKDESIKHINVLKRVNYIKNVTERIGTEL